MWRNDVITWPARVKPTAGPPWSVTDDDRRQTPGTVTSLAPPPTTMAWLPSKEIGVNTW